MWDNLKASIASVVRTNNNQEITGANLQNVLNTIVNTVGANATFAGIAIPSTNPGTPDGPVFYIACEPGVYSNFNLTLVDGLYILENKTGSWVGTQINIGAAFEALISYYNAVLNGASITVPDATTYRLTVGGDFKLKMLAPGTTATTLTIGNATDIPIWYNGAVVSAQNTWEANEIISVFYDGTRFMASNSQGGGGKAEKIKYNNSESGLAADNVQEALDINSEDINKLKGVVGEDVTSEFSLVGNNGTGVQKVLHLEAGKRYELSTNMTAADYSNSSIQNGINVYSFTKVVNGTGTNLFVTFKGTDTVPSKYMFIAEEADTYIITIRANSGTTINFELTKYYDSNLIVGKKEFNSEKVDTNKFGFYNYDNGFRIYFGRIQRLDCYKFPVRVVVTGIPSGVTCILETFENYSDTLNPNVSNHVEFTGWGVTNYTFSNSLSNYLKLNFKSTASGSNPKITNAQLASIKSDVRVSITSYIKLGGVHGENYDIDYEGGSLEEKVTALDNRSKMLDKILTLDDFVCSWATHPNDPSGYTKTRYRCAIEVPKIPVCVKVEGVPSSYIGSVNQSDSLANALSALVNPVEGTSWGVLEHTFEEHNDALWIMINFKKGSAGTAEFTQADMDAINQSVTVSIYPWMDAGTTNKADIISLNDENRTLRYLRNLRRPNYSLDGRYTAGLTPFTLLHFSDLHSDKVNLKRIVEYKEHYAEYIDDAILTGDNIRDKFGDSFAFWSECGADNILLTTGNHEYYNGESSAYYTQITPLQVYNKFFAPYYENWGTVVFPIDAETEGYNYYYKDYTAKKIRLIVLDNMANMSGNRTNVQATWLASVLESARTAGLHVICAIHIGSTIETPFNNPFTSYRNSFNSDTGVNAATFAEFYTLRDAVKTFIDNGGKFVAWIAGHRHVDTIAVLTDDIRQGSIHVATASGGEFSSNTGGHGDTDANNNGHSWWIIPKGDDCDRTDDTKQQDCFNIYSVDTEKQLLRIFRVGSDVDRNGRHKGSLLYDYANRQVLYCD